MEMPPYRDSPVHKALDEHVEEWRHKDPDVVKRAGKPVQLELPLDLNFNLDLNYGVGKEGA